MRLFPENFSFENMKAEYAATWRCPSNIALVKYWGKRPEQIPCNASVSFTLSKAYTETKITAKKVDKFSVKFFLDDVRNEAFETKISKYFNIILNILPFVQSFSYEIHSYNSFPHSSGIASSASGFGALALGLLDMSYQMMGKNIDEDFFHKASYLARLGSGSASRSMYGGLVMWGKHKDFHKSSDEFASPWKVANEFLQYKDYILLIDKGQKEVSSTLGHSLMNDHPFAEARFVQANKNMTKLYKGFLDKNAQLIRQISEEEALTLHSMMMTSNPYFMLFKPNTVAVIQEMWRLREQGEINMFFTLDAGANVHLLVHKSQDELFKSEVLPKLTPFCANHHFIEDEVGTGPEKLA